MNSKKSLIYGQALIFLIVFVSFGVIIINEKGQFLFSKKINEKINTYLKENYTDLNSSINKSELNYINTTYKMKITSKKNKDLYFYLTYKNGKITDTYKEDYLEGKSLLNNLNNKMTKEINNKTKDTYKINFISTLDNYNLQVQDKIINEDNLLNLKFYYIEKEITINSFDSYTITNEIIKNINNLLSNNITPKYYEFTFINKNDITTSLKLSNIKEDFITNTNNINIINEILKDNKDIKKYTNIKYEYTK